MKSILSMLGLRSTDDIKGQIAAINKSQAVIEFSLDGKVLAANRNFLQTFGYDLAEIRGRHHRMFVDPAEHESAAYRAFWERLRQGQFEKGQYKRIAKDGREVWIEATYNPIFDRRGVPFKVVKYATDITQQRLQAAESAGQLAAIDKTQAVIEFDLDGLVIRANDNFLRVVGYGLEDIKGRHHRMFVDPAYAQSEEYRRFWEKLRSGVYDAGQYRRIGKGGREVWLQASYNPILDPDGKPYKIVKFATDVTGQVETVEAVQRIVTQAVDGDLTGRIRTDGRTGNLLALSQSINALLEQMMGIVGEIRESVSSVRSGAQEIARGSTDLSQRTSEQASSLEETASSMEEMASTVKQTADNVSMANQLSNAARMQAERGSQVVARAVSAMNGISESSRKISDIITVIDEIAFQTNLLALNAAVEAARAGEQGRGFAVVANEVRTLAGRSATAAKEIKALIVESVSKVGEGAGLVDQSGQALEEIVTSVKKANDVVAEIDGACREQSSGIDQVNKAVTTMDDVTQQNAALVEEATAASQSLLEQAERLEAMMAKFKVGAQRAEAQSSGARRRLAA
jgi:methyl-accepting chemotaxis protein